MSEQDVERIRQRHVAFIEQYSPGPDWEPCNQLSRDRGALLELVDALRTRLAAAEAQSESRRKTLLEVREQQKEDWIRAERAEADLAAARRALAEQVSHRAGCCWTWGQGCDCGSVDALLAPERPR